MNQAQSDKIFDTVQNSLRESRQIYRKLRDDNNVKEALKVLEKIKELELQVDDLLAKVFTEWQGDAEDLLPRLSELEKELNNSISKIKDRAKVPAVVSGIINSIDKMKNSFFLKLLNSCTDAWLR